MNARSAKKYKMLSITGEVTGNSDIGPDGPYVIYHDKKCEVITIEENRKTGFDVYRQMFDAEQVYDRTFVCTVDHPGKPHFSFQINPHITIPPSIYSTKKPVSIVAISDIEGNFESFRNLLIGS